MGSEGGRGFVDDGGCTQEASATATLKGGEHNFGLAVHRPLTSHDTQPEGEDALGHLHTAGIAEGDHERLSAASVSAVTE